MALKATVMTSATGRVKGFTFIELLIIIIIIGILVGISLPQFRNNVNRLQLNSFSRELQSFMNYLHERAVVEGEVIYLAFDMDNNEYWAQVKGKSQRLKTYHFPEGIKIETEENQINFYPDGSIDKTTIMLKDSAEQSVNLTTKGVFGRVKEESK